MPFSRFLAPLWPSAALLVSSWLVSLGRSRRRVAALLTVLVAASTLGTYSLQILRYFRNEGLDSMLMRGDDTLAVGLWLSENVEPGSTVRTARLGGMSYGAPELIFWDENGLTDRAHANLDFRRKSGWSQLESGPSARAGRGGGPPRSREMELYRRRGRARAASLRLLPRFPVSPGELRRGPHLGPAPALAGLPYEAIATIFAFLRTRP